MEPLRATAQLCYVMAFGNGSSVGEHGSVPRVAGSIPAHSPIERRVMRVELTYNVDGRKGGIVLEDATKDQVTYACGELALRTHRIMDAIATAAGMNRLVDGQNAKDTAKK